MNNKQGEKMKEVPINRKLPHALVKQLKFIALKRDMTFGELHLEILEDFVKNGDEK